MLKKCILLTVAVCTAPRTLAAQGGAPNFNQGVSASLQQSIPLRDGVHLSATMWRPLDQAKPLPVVLMVTPYVSDETHNRAVKFVKGGYVYVVVDVRGRGDSEGVFWPLEDAGADGAEVVEWLARQPWCDGRVAMIGGSYRGMVQWDIVAQHPRHLAAIVPTAAVYPGFDFPNWKGFMLSYVVQWLALVSGHTAHDQLFGDSDFWSTQFVRMYKEGAPFESLAPLAQSNRPAFEAWIWHHGDDAYWAAFNPKPQAYAGAEIPVLAITGYFDDDQPGELRHYREFVANVSDRERDQVYLLVGPWNHEGTRYPQKQLGGRSFSDDSVVDIDQLQIDWFNWVLKGGKRPGMISDRVNYYEMGDGTGRWMHARSLQAMSDRTLRFYLSSQDGPANDVFHSGRLAAEVPPAQDVDTLRIDPRAQEGLPLNDGSRFLVDQSSSFQKRILIYQSEPLPTPLTIAGAMKLTASLSLDTPDADLGVEVDAVLPDGRFLQLGSDLIRARFRHGMGHEELVTPGRIESYVFDGFNLTDQRLPAGSRLRLVLAPVDTPYVECNDNTGGPLGVGGTRNGRVATFSVHMDPEHPSFLELPVTKE